jgi:hypothetical protein
MDVDPVYCEIVVRRLEHFRRTKRTGWQNSNPFAIEIAEDQELRAMLSANGEAEANNDSAAEPIAGAPQRLLFT